MERQRPFARLAAALEEARSGTGRVVVLHGEAGIGKTALVRTFVEGERAAALLGRCDDTSVPSVLGPFRDVFAAARLPASFDDADDVRARIPEVLAAARCLVIEDIHWADEASLDLIAHIGRRIDREENLLILTLRPSSEPDVTRCLAQLPPDVTDDITLEPLSATTVAAMAAAAGRDGAKVYDLTGGNPFLVGELLANPEGDVPARVSTATLARLALVSDEAQELARLLAVFPAGAGWTLVEQLRPGSLDALDELESRGWFDPLGPRIVFRHELVRRAIESSLSTARRRALNREVLDALTAGGGDPAPIAHHAVEAGDDQRSIEYAIIAAREMSRGGAHRDALVHLDRVAHLAHLLSDDERAQFREALGMELLIGNRPEDGLAALLEAEGLWTAVGDIAGAARVLVAASNAAWRMGELDRSTEVLERALGMLDGTDHHEQRFRAQVIIAQSVGLMSRWPEALERVEVALAEARDLGDEAQAVALGIRADARRLLGDETGALADYERSLGHSAGVADQMIAMRTLSNRVATSLATLNLDEIETQLDTAEALAESMQSPYAQMSLRGYRCGLHYLRGQWEPALELAEQLLDDRQATHVRPLYIAAMIRLRRGDDTALELLRDAREQASALSDIQRLGYVGAALAEARWLGKARETSSIQEITHLALRSGHATYGAELTLWCRRLGLDAPDPPDRGPAGFLLELGGDWQAAAAEWNRVGLPYHRVLTLGFSTDVDAIHTAIAEATRLRATTTADRLRAQLRELGHDVRRGPSRTRLSNPAGLTNRQLDVVKLLAAGLTNQEIADRLYISPKTVDHHVSAILSRLGVADRGAAGAWAVAEGLTADT